MLIQIRKVRIYEGYPGWHGPIPAVGSHPGHPDSKEERNRDIDFESGWPGWLKQSPPFP